MIKYINTNRVLLNVGCGHTRPNNWINTDSSLNAQIQRIGILRVILAKFSKRVEYTSANVRYMDLNKPWHFKNESIDVVYGSHVFEHLSLVSANQFMAESYRVLRAGGAIRIVVPDLYKLAKIYIQAYEDGSPNSSKSFLEKVNLHKENTYASDKNYFLKIINLTQGYPHQHKYMYDSRSLKEILLNYGFHSVNECLYGESIYIPEIKQVEFTKEGVPAIYLEALKPL